MSQPDWIPVSESYDEADGALMPRPGGQARRNRPDR